MKKCNGESGGIEWREGGNGPLSASACVPWKHEYPWLVVVRLPRGGMAIAYLIICPNDQEELKGAVSTLVNPHSPHTLLLGQNLRPCEANGGS